MHTSQSSFTDSFFLIFIIYKKSVLLWDIWFYIIDFSGLRNVPSQILHTECFQPVESKEKFISVRWMYPSDTSFSDSFFLLSMVGYSVFNYWPQWVWNGFSQILQKQCFQHDESKERFNSVIWIHTSENNVKDSFFLVFITRFFFFFFSL